MSNTNIYDVRVMGGVFGTCSISSGSSGAIAAGTNATAFQDDLGTSTTSNVTQTNSFGNQFGGLVENGTQLTMFGLQVVVYAQDSSSVSIALPIVDCQELITKTRLELNSKGNRFSVGPPILYPCGGKGAYSPGATAHANNGGDAAPVFRLPASMPIQLKSQDQWSINVAFTVPGAGLTASTTYFYLFYLPATRAYTFRSLGAA